MSAKCWKLRKRNSAKVVKIVLICFKVRKAKDLSMSFLKCLCCFPEPSHMVYCTLLSGVEAGQHLVSVLFLLSGLWFCQLCAGARSRTSVPDLTVHIPLKLGIQ